MLQARASQLPTSASPAPASFASSASKLNRKSSEKLVSNEQPMARARSSSCSSVNYVVQSDSETFQNQEDSNGSRGRKKYSVILNENKKLKEDLEKYAKMLKDSKAMPPPSQPDAEDSIVDMTDSQ